jgi:hypothetical protein
VTFDVTGDVSGAIGRVAKDFGATDGGNAPSTSPVTLAASDAARGAR